MALCAATKPMMALTEAAIPTRKRTAMRGPAASARLCAGILSPQYTLTITPYLRRSSMTFLQHWLPGQPFEQNAQTSGGALLRLGFDGAWRWTAGAVVEAFAARLLERQDTPTRGSAFLVATRPAGIHYDYRVDGLTLAAFYDLGVDLNPALELVASGRVERNAYKLRQSAPCGQYARRRLVMRLRRRCLYTRPADRDDDYLNWAGRLGFNWSVREDMALYAVAGQGFRPPQTTELYRLQRGQRVADLESETVRAVEAGWRGAVRTFSYEVALYADVTENLIFRDANGFNVSDGETESRGVEANPRLAHERSCIPFGRKQRPPPLRVHSRRQPRRTHRSTATP